MALDDAPLRFEYTMGSLHALAQKTAREAVRWRYLPYSERYDIAWSAIAEAIYSSEAYPHPHELVMIGWKAIDRELLARVQMHGMVMGQSGGTRPRFNIYWWSQAAPTRSHEDHVIESIALRQIWRHIRDTRKRALVALAICDDYELAAKMLGISYQAYKNKVNRARRDFRKLWHEGEQPPRFWGRDHRKRQEGAKTNNVTQVAIRARHRKRKARAALKGVQTDDPERSSGEKSKTQRAAP
jgi:hypothetical protein